MSSEAATDLCRVTLIAGQRRLDVALPTSVPLAYLLPTLLRQAGEELADTGVSHGGWALQRLGGWPFDTGQSAAALGIQDGEVLYLRPRQQELPPPVFDDVVEAIGWTLAERTTRWNAATTKAAGLAATGFLLTVGIVTVLLAGPPWYAAASAAGLVSVLLIVGGGAMSRAFGDAAVGGLLGCASVPFALLAAMLGLLPQQAQLSGLGAAQLLAGASAALVAVVLAALAVGGAEPVFLGVGLVVVVAFVAGLAARFTSDAGTAALAIGLVFLINPVLPAVAYRLARLPAPFLPTTAEELRKADTTLAATRLSERSLVADRYVTALLAGSAVVYAAGGLFIWSQRGWSVPLLLALIACLAFLRMRLFTGRAQRIWLLAAGLLAAGEFVLAMAEHMGNRPVRAGLTVLVLVLAFALAAVAARPERSASPPRARMLDIFEVVVGIGTIPVILDILGVYGYIRSLFG